VWGNDDAATMHLTELVSSRTMALRLELSHVRHAESGLH
jgi:hypothetical protein